MDHVHLPTAAGVGPSVLVKVCHTLILISPPPFYFFYVASVRTTSDARAYCARPVPRTVLRDRGTPPSAAACGPSHGPFCALFRGRVRPVPRTVLRALPRTVLRALPRPRAARPTDRSARSSAATCGPFHGPFCAFADPSFRGRVRPVSRTVLRDRTYPARPRAASCPSRG